jgi:hypothetical protein
LRTLTEDEVAAAVYDAVGDLNRSLPDDRKIPLAGNADVFSMVDSLGALNLILLVEQRIGEVTGTEYDLTDGDLYETTLFGSPSLDALTVGIFKALSKTG